MLGRYDELMRTQNCSKSVPEFAELKEPEALVQTFLKYFGSEYDLGNYKATDTPALAELDTGRLMSINGFRQLLDAVAK